MMMQIWLRNLILNQLHLEPGVGVEDLTYQDLGGLDIINFFLA